MVRGTRQDDVLHGKRAEAFNIWTAGIYISSLSTYQWYILATSYLTVYIHTETRKNI